MIVPNRTGARCRALFVVCVLNVLSCAQDSTAVPIQPQTSALPSAGMARNIPVVAVVTLDAQEGVSPREAMVIADNLTSQLQQSRSFRVMERSRMEKILEEQSFQRSGACDSSQCAVEIGKILGIDQLVVGSVGKVGTVYSLNLRLVDVKTGEAVRTTTRNRKGAIEDVLTDLLPQAAADLEGRVPDSAVAEPERKRRIWPWVLGGAVVAGGGTAAVLLLSSKSSSPTNTPDAHFGVSW